MAIRSVDMQIMTPRMADLSIMHQHEKEKPLMQQLQMVAHEKKEIEHNKQVVRKTSKHSETKNDDNAKDKGKNSYFYHKAKHSRQEITKEDEHLPEGHSFDRKI